MNNGRIAQFEPRAASRLEADLRQSLLAENVARELAPAVHGKPWHDLERWQQEQLRESAEALIRSFDHAAAAVARYDARQTFFNLLRIEPRLREWDVVSDAFEQAMKVYLVRLATGVRVRPETTPAQERAYARGVVDPHADDYLQMGPLDPRD